MNENKAVKSAIAVGVREAFAINPDCEFFEYSIELLETNDEFYGKIAITGSHTAELQLCPMLKNSDFWVYKAEGTLTVLRYIVNVYKFQKRAE